MQEVQKLNITAVKTNRLSDCVYDDCEESAVWSIYVPDDIRFPAQSICQTHFQRIQRGTSLLPY